MKGTKNEKHRNFGNLYLRFSSGSDNRIAARGFEKNWHHWRGPHATGAAVEADPPTTWSETENIRWKVAIPGTGHAAPIIWEDKIFIQTAIKIEAPKAELEQKQMTINHSAASSKRDAARWVNRYV